MMAARTPMNRNTYFSSPARPNGSLITVTVSNVAEIEVSAVLTTVTGTENREPRGASVATWNASRSVTSWSDRRCAIAWSYRAIRVSFSPISAFHPAGGWSTNVASSSKSPTFASLNRKIATPPGSAVTRASTLAATSPRVSGVSEITMSSTHHPPGPWRTRAEALSWIAIVAGPVTPDRFAYTTFHSCWTPVKEPRDRHTPSTLTFTYAMSVSTEPVRLSIPRPRRSNRCHRYT